MEQSFMIGTVDRRSSGQGEQPKDDGLNPDKDKDCSSSERLLFSCQLPKVLATVHEPLIRFSVAIPMHILKTMRRYPSSERHVRFF
jgi:hypothetical protein